MKNLYYLLALFAFSFSLSAQQISGSVSDENGDPLPGASIVVDGSSRGVTSDFDGNFTIAASNGDKLVVSYVGYKSQTIDVGSSSTISVQMQLGSALDEVVISASRRAEKVQDAPASVSIISSEDISNSANFVDPVRSLINIPGVQVQQQSANSLNFEMRAGSGVFGTSTFPILDYRYLITPAAGLFISSQTGLSNIDIERVEVVRGAASALYGPGVTSGVVHFLSKKAIDHPGTTIELFAGTQASMGGAIRHAYANQNKTFGYKINARFSKGDEWELDPIRDAQTIEGFFRNIRQPAINNQMVDASRPGKKLLGMGDLDPDGDGNPLANEYSNYSVNAHLEFRPNEITSAVLSGGLSNGNGLFFNSQGYGLVQGNDYWGQARVQSGGFFGQVYYNYNDGGDEENPTFLYSSGYRQVTKRSSLEAQLQYNFDLENFLNSTYTVGMDYRNNGTDSEYTLFGRNDDNDPYVITGFYGQGTSRFSDKLDLTYALRYDKINFIDEGAIAPRIALVWKPSASSSWRLSYNESTFGPTALETYIDFPVQTLAPGVADVWLSGQIDAQGFSSNPSIELLGLGTSLPYGSTSVPNALTYNVLQSPSIGFFDAFYAGIQASDFAAFLPAIQNFFNNYTPSGSFGTLTPYNVFNGQPMDELVGTGAAEIGRMKSWEIGYKGMITDKIALGVDVYTYERSGFTQFTAIGPTYRLGGTSSYPTELGSLVAGDFTSDPTINAILNGAVTAQVMPLVQQGVEAQYALLGIPEVFWATGLPADALFPGSAAVPSVADATAATAAPIIQSTVSDYLAQAYGLVAGGFAQGAQGFLGAINPAAFGIVETDRVPNDNMSHISAGYRRYGNATRSHVGTDIALEYFATDEITWWGNASLLSQNVWIPGEANDDDLPFSSYLNAPKFKYRLGMNYNGNNGIRFSAAYQHDDSFESDQGFFGGTVQEKDLLDANIGYTFNNGISLDLSGTNLADLKYRAFPGMPIIGRRLILKATYNF